MVTDRAQGMQRKAVPIYLQHHVLGKEAVRGHALGTCNRIQKSIKVQRKKNTSIEESTLQLTVGDLEEPKDKIVQCEEKANSRLHAVG